MNRGERRYRTRKIALKRHRQWVEQGGWHAEDAQPGYWKKLGCGCCRCAKRQHGRPKLAKGPCETGARNRIYRARAEVRELRRLIGNGEDPDSDAVSGVTHPQPWRDCSY